MGTRQGLRKNMKIPGTDRKSTKPPSKNPRAESSEGLGFKYLTNRNVTRIMRPRKEDIPIIVRKLNNTIENVSASYPLSLEQEQAINLIL